MKTLLLISRCIDALTDLVSQIAMWLTLLAVLISAGNAVVRKVFSLSSNAFLEMQWYLFSALFLLGTSYALKKGAHVKIDVISSRLSRRSQLLVDCLGTILFLFPFCIAVTYYTIPIFLNTLMSGEMSENAGGLIRWPLHLVVLIGFVLLMAQGASELIKKVDQLLMNALEESQRSSQ